MARTRTAPQVALVFAFVLLPTLARGADVSQPAAQFEERVDVSEALLDVLVTDRDGNVVLGLEPEDFKVEVDGRPAEVTGATFYSNRRFLDSGAAERVGVDPSAVPDRRYFVLVFDDQRQEAFDHQPLLARQLEAGRELTRWLRDEVLSTDLVAVLSWDVRLRLHQDFTHDLAALERAVSRASRGEAPPKDWPSRQAPGSLLPAIADQLPEAATVAKESTDFHRAVTLLANALQGIPGRKNLVLFSGGFGDLNSLGQYVPDARYDRALLRALNGANVAVYGIDVTPAGTRHPLENSLVRISNATGGLSSIDVIRFGIPLERIARETNGYYLVSVRATNGEAEYRDVEVKAANREFRVRSRGGFRFETGRFETGG